MVEVEPLVAVIGDCSIAYRGRAKAEQDGGTVVVLVKRDGTVSVHALDSGVQPQFYNPAGTVELNVDEGTLSLDSISDSGEILEVRGAIHLLERLPSAESVERPERQWISGIEADLVNWIQENPGAIGLEDADLEEREDHRVGGRVDLLFEGCVVEAKKRAGVDVYDQVLRYLRNRDVDRARIVCLHASEGLLELAEKDDRVGVVVVDRDEFEASIQGAGG